MRFFLHGCANSMSESIYKDYSDSLTSFKYGKKDEDTTGVYFWVI